mgnify:CR=1 FL=1
MTDLNKILTSIYLSETAIKKVIELFFFSYREFTSGPDKILNKLNFGRAHHRIIYFVGKNKKITIKDLLTILKIKKQSLSRVLNQLVEKKYIIVSIGDDKRTKNLSLTKLGNNIEKQLSKIQIDYIKNVFQKFDENDINGFKKILYALIDDENKSNFDNLNK